MQLMATKNVEKTWKTGDVNLSAMIAAEKGKVHQRFLRLK
jgi:hypothetical protein